MKNLKSVICYTILLPFFTIACTDGFKPFSSSKLNSSSNSNVALLLGKALYDSKCMICHGPFDNSSIRNKKADRINWALANVVNMAPLNSQLTAEQITSLELALSTGTNSSGRVQFACNPQSLPTNSIQRLSNREYKAAVTAILNDINSSLILDSQLQSYFQQLPTDIIGGKENTLVLSPNLISLQNDIAYRAGFLIGSSSAYTNTLPGTNGCLTNNSVTSTCLNNFINELGRRALRRPVTASERANLTTLFNDPAGTTLAIKVTMVVAALLDAPDFKYQIYDQGSAKTTNRTDLNAFEYASKLSFFLTGAPPDATLRSVSDNGTILSDPIVANAQIDRLLATPASRTNIIRFFREWMQYDQFDSFQYSTPFVNGISLENLKQDMTSEIDDFVADVTLGKKTYSDLMLSTQTKFNSNSLATIYGITNPAGAIRNLSSTQRAGLLTRAAFLTKRSGNLTSPVLRGKFLLTQILCGSIGAPPPDAPPSLDPLPTGSYITTRERVFSKTEQPGTSCIACHSRMNNLGYPFEHYDSLGRFRTVEAMYDSSGNALNITLPVNSIATSNELESTAITFDNSISLAQSLANNDKALSCFSLKWHEFQIRKTPTAEYNCAMNESLNTLYGSPTTQGSIFEMIKASVLSPSFKEWGY